MILIDGKIVESAQQANILEDMTRRINEALRGEELDYKIVIEACDTLAKRAEEGAYKALLSLFEGDEKSVDQELKKGISLLKRESLEAMYHMQLGDIGKEKEGEVLRRKYMPLGVLFHIAAGNVDGLPAFSVVEGLLAGNINILKLPQADGGLSIKLLQELITIEPRLAPWIYIFDTPSTDFEAMEKMAELADGIVVWGGDAAITAIRNKAKPGTRLIEWGHKLGFAYITLDGITETSLKALAAHIFETKQVLCSSCQTLFIDTLDLKEVEKFCEIFLPYLEDAARLHPIHAIGRVAECTLKVYNAELEAMFNKQKVFKGEGCSLIVKEDSELEISFMFGNCLVKRLPREKIIESLRRQKGYLQTATLMCGKNEQLVLMPYLFKAGVVRVRRAEEMGLLESKEAHDGEYPLRRYSRVVDYRVEMM